MQLKEYLMVFNEHLLCLKQHFMQLKEHLMPGNERFISFESEEDVNSKVVKEPPCHLIHRVIFGIHGYSMTRAQSID